MQKRLLPLLLLMAMLTALRAMATESGGEGMTVGTPDSTKWYNRTHSIREITVEGRRERYSRKNNPAVELMRRVIAAKRRTRPEQRDYYRYNKHQKTTFAANGITISDLQSGAMSHLPGVLRQIEVCPYNNKLILPMMVSETITQKIYSRKPRREREILKGERSSGIDKMFRSGEILTEALRDFFTDVDIYDNNIRLLQNRFTSPIADDAIAFYRYYITDTVDVAGDTCVHLRFMPNNQRDFGFAGDLFIVKDSSYQVKRCLLTLPAMTTVNFVEGMFIAQEFARDDDGQWLLTTDDMMVELSIFDFMYKAAVIRNTRMTSHRFDPIDDREFTEGNDYDLRREAKKRDMAFWDDNRQVRLTPSESRVDRFVDDIESGSRYKSMKFLFRLLVENYIETSGEKDKNKFDIGPVNTFVSHNDIDGWRVRVGGKTTANLCPQLFAEGYYAHGFDSKNHYYNAALTYSFNKKDYLPDEFPMRNITFSSSKDICSPADKFMTTDKDNVFTSFKWADEEQMMLYDRQQLRFDREEKCNWRTSLVLTAEKNTPCGTMTFLPLDDGSGMIGKPIRTTEARLELRFAPGERFVDTRNHRMAINEEAPIFTLSHAVGFDGVLGGQYNYHHTEFAVFKKLWLNRWGHIDVNLAAGAQWSRVPYPLLCMPAANLSYILQPGTFRLINNMEFLNDRYASLSLEWDLGGKLFNRLPLLKTLKWREYLGVKTLWGTLTEKNNPFLAENSGNSLLMHFPTTSHIMDGSEPYVEVFAGIHNVFRFFHIEYVRRLNYLNLPTANKHGVRLKFTAEF